MLKQIHIETVLMQHRIHNLLSLIEMIETEETLGETLCVNKEFAKVSTCFGCKLKYSLS